MKNVKILTGFITSRRYLNLLQSMYESKNFTVEIIRPDKNKMLFPYFFNDLYKNYGKEIKEYDYEYNSDDLPIRIIEYNLTSNDTTEYSLEYIEI